MKDKSVSLMIELTDEQWSSFDFEDKFDKLEKQFKEYDINGVYISRINNRIELYFGTTFFEKKKKNSRNAGRKRVHGRDKTQKEELFDGYIMDKIIRYSDIVLKLDQGATLKEMLEYTGFTQPTYYRHLNVMKKSEFYKVVDHQRLSDQEYLENIKEIDETF